MLPPPDPLSQPFHSNPLKSAGRSDFPTLLPFFETVLPLSSAPFDKKIRARSPSPPPRRSIDQLAACYADRCSGARDSARRHRSTRRFARFFKRLSPPLLPIDRHRASILRLNRRPDKSTLLSCVELARKEARRFSRIRENNAAALLT